MKNQVFRWTARILFMDTDASGRIHYTALFRYFETAETEFFRAVGVLHEHTGSSFPRVHVECDYRAAITYDDLLVFEVSVGRIGYSSIKLRFRVLKDEVEVAAGTVVIACMDRKTQRAAAIPPLMREKLEPYLFGE
jgi:YbgC/YbaW family acyl-CoA thioester hydrolase